MAKPEQNASLGVLRIIDGNPQIFKGSQKVVDRIVPRQIEKSWPPDQ